MPCYRVLQMIQSGAVKSARSLQIVPLWHWTTRQTQTSNSNIPQCFRRCRAQLSPAVNKRRSNVNHRLQSVASICHRENTSPLCNLWPNRSANICRDKHARMRTFGWHNLANHTIAKMRGLLPSKWAETSVARLLQQLHNPQVLNHVRTTP